MCDRKVTSTDSSVQTSFLPASELVVTAERELAAYYTAISATYGLEEAMQAAHDWIEELERADKEKLKCAPRHIAGALPNWRSVTISAAHRLASRVIGGPSGR